MRNLLFGTTIFLAAFLLFLVEPMAAKSLLPILGGSSAVWITCLVFFQALLLGGYLYAHWLTAATTSRKALHLFLLLIAAATAALPFATQGDSTHPIWTVFRLLSLSIGLPFLLLASTSPLLQVWRARVEQGSVRYGLFGLSNAGSLLGLLAYPILIEPHLPLHLQRKVWAAGLWLFTPLAAIITLRTKAAAEQPTIETAPRTAAKTRLLWFLLPAGAAMQLAAITSHLTSNIAAIPMLWMLPLAAYLLSFILAFELPRLYHRTFSLRLLLVLLASLGYLLSQAGVALPIAISLPLFLLELFVACFVLHAETFRLRPQSPSETTSFYLHLAAGGVCGTFFVGILSPLVFSANYDLALAFTATSALILTLTWQHDRAAQPLWAAATVACCVLVLIIYRESSRIALAQQRNFYGTLTVLRQITPAGPTRVLLNGTIEHGTQILNRVDLASTPTTYYAPDSGVGLALAALPATRPRHIGVIGLGAGTLAAYATRPDDRFRFYEINPLVQPIAAKWFTYLNEAHGQISYATGDGRASLHAESPQQFDLLVVDAFSGDAIPLHLLTVEAMQEYKRHLAPGGTLAFHVSNQYLNLPPEIAALADVSGLQARLVDSPAQPNRGEYHALWVLVSSDPNYWDQPALAGHTAPLAHEPGLKAWTDDYSSVLQVVRWALR